METATVQNDPFTFFLFETPFAPATYQAMMANIPDSSLYYELPHLDALRSDGTSTRKVFELSPRNIGRLSPPVRQLWGSITEILHSDAARKAVFVNLAPAIARRMKISRKEAQDLVAYPRCSITEDSEGFRIGVHPDWHTKLVTVQFYLANDHFHQGLGTHFYRGTETPFLTPTYRPNCGYAFAVEENSWHSREILPKTDRKRLTLALTYFIEPPEPYQEEDY